MFTPALLAVALPGCVSRRLWQLLSPVWTTSASPASASATEEHGLLLPNLQLGCFAFTPCSLLKPSGTRKWTCSKDTAFSKAGKQSLYLQYTSTGRNQSFSVSLDLHIRELVSFLSPQTHRGWFPCNKLGKGGRPLFIYFPMETSQLVLVNNGILWWEIIFWWEALSQWPDLGHLHTEGIYPPRCCWAESSPEMPWLLMAPSCMLQR